MPIGSFGMDLFSCLIEELYLQGATIIKDFRNKFFLENLHKKVKEIDVLDFNTVFYIPPFQKIENPECDLEFILTPEEEIIDENPNLIKINEIVLHIYLTFIYNAKLDDFSLPLEEKQIKNIIYYFRKMQISESKKAFTNPLSAQHKENSNLAEIENFLNEENFEDENKQGANIKTIFSEDEMHQTLECLLKTLDRGLDYSEAQFKEEMANFYYMLVPDKDDNHVYFPDEEKGNFYWEDFKFADAFSKKINLFKFSKLSEAYNNDKYDLHGVHEEYKNMLLNKYFLSAANVATAAAGNVEADQGANLSFNNFNNNGNNNNNFNNYGYANNDFGNLNQFGNNNYNNNNRNQNQYSNNNNYNNNNNFNNQNRNLNQNNHNNNNNNMNMNNSFNKNNNSSSNNVNNRNFKSTIGPNSMYANTFGFSDNEEERKRIEENQKIENNKNEFLNKFRMKFLLYEKSLINESEGDCTKYFFNFINNVYAMHISLDREKEKQTLNSTNITNNLLNNNDATNNNNNNTNDASNIPMQNFFEQNNLINNDNNNNIQSNLNSKFPNQAPNNNNNNIKRDSQYTNYNNNNNFNLNNFENLNINASNEKNNANNNEFNFLIYLLPNPTNTKRSNDKVRFNNICNHIANKDYLYKTFINTIWSHNERINEIKTVYENHAGGDSEKILNYSKDELVKNIKSIFKFTLKRYLAEADKIFELFTYEIKVFSKKNPEQPVYAKIFCQNFEMLLDQKPEELDKNRFESIKDSIKFDIE